MSDKPTRSFEHSIEIAAPVSAVWKAITEGDEIVKWFAPIARVTPGEGGEVFLSWGEGMEGKAPIRVWEPGKRFGWLEREGTDSPRIAEFILEAKSDGKTVLRIVQSGFGAGAEFDDELDTIGGGWKTFFAMLKYGVERFPGAPAKNVAVLRMIPMPQAEAWSRLASAIGLPVAVSAGSMVDLHLDSIRISATVIASPKPGYVCLSASSHNDSLLAIFVEKGGPSAMITLEWILFGDGQQHQPAILPAYERLLNETFPSKAAAASQPVTGSSNSAHS